MTRPRHARPAGFLAAAVHNASRTTLVLAVGAVVLVGTDAAVAVSRHGGSSSPAAVATEVSSPTTNAAPGMAVNPTPPASTTNQPAGPDPRALLAKAFANALSAGSVHAVARNVTKKIGTAIFDDYDAKTGGIQRISIYGGHVTVRVVGRATYFSGDERGLTRYMGFTADEVAALHHKWLRLTAGEAGYKAVTAGVTLASTLHEDRIGAPLRLLPQRRVNGVHVVGVRGRALGGGAPKNAIATMWISADNNPLPVEYVARSRKLHLTQTFSAWGKRFHLAPPTDIFGHKTLRA